MLFAAAAGIALLATGVSIAKSRTPEQRVHRELVAWGIADDMRTTPEDSIREDVPLDEENDDGLARVVSMLSDVDRLEDGDSHSEITVQVAANRYLLHRAERLHFAPPALAISVARDVDHHTAVRPEAWQKLASDWASALANPTAPTAVAAEP
jgi:hypothetical protein